MWRARLFPPDQLNILCGVDIHLQWTSWPGGHYQVVRSADLQAWTNAGTVVVAATNLTTWTETPPQPKQFYRLLTLP
jgi:hypothetical protein